MTYRFTPLLLSGLLSLAFGGGACGDDLKAVADSGLQRTTQLKILAPPGDSIGLTFSGSARLRVLYLDDEGRPIVGGKAEFKLVSSSGESTGGASLSSTSTVTDELGIARVDLLSGAERVNFRVEVSAPQAPPVLFYIQVSQQGFTNLQVHSAHEGPRDPESYDRIQLRIYSQTEVSCTTLDFDELPPSVFPSRTQSAVGESSTFANLAADESYTVIAWGEIEDGRPLASGCLDLAADKLRSGSTLTASLAVIDRSYELTEPLLVNMEIDLSALRNGLPGESYWRILACPLGRAQLLLSCLADAQSSDGTLDCDSESASPLSTAMTPRRGVVDGDGCRGALDDSGAMSLEAALDQALNGWPSDAELASLVQGRSAVLDTLHLSSRLQRSGVGIVSHRLLEAQLGSFTLDLVSSDRPVIEVTGLPVSINAAPLLGVSSHGFTLRFGDLAAQAYEELALQPADVSARADSLGAEFISGLSIGAQSGCLAIESFVCGQLSLPASCADACGAISTPLSELLFQWLPALVATGVDYRLATQASILDMNNDLRIDGLEAFGDDISIELVAAEGSESLPATLSASVE